MILITDTHYSDNRARTAGMVIQSWTDRSHCGAYIWDRDRVADYEPGQFYKRELPGILGLIDASVCVHKSCSKASF